MRVRDVRARRRVRPHVREAQHTEEWEFITNDCEAKVLIAATKAIYEKTKGFPGKLPKLEKVICLEGDDDASYASLLARGKASPVPSIHPDPSDICG